MGCGTGNDNKTLFTWETFLVYRNNVLMPHPTQLQHNQVPVSLPWSLGYSESLQYLPSLTSADRVVWWITCLLPQSQPKLPHLSRPVTLQSTQGEDLSRLKQAQKGKKRWLMHQMWRRQQKSLRNVENQKNMTTPKEQNKFQQVKPTSAGQRTDKNCLQELQRNTKRQLREIKKIIWGETTKFMNSF